LTVILSAGDLSQTPCPISNSPAIGLLSKVR
jgi:hypothetical protein